MTTRLHHTGLMCHDIDLSMRFYTKIFGHVEEPSLEFPKLGTVHMLHANSDFRIGLFQAGDRPLSRVLEARNGTGI